VDEPQRAVISEVLRGTRAGGTAVNDTLVHFYRAPPVRPGVGNSGVGKAHGLYGFERSPTRAACSEQPLPFSTSSSFSIRYQQVKRSDRLTTVL